MTCLEMYFFIRLHSYYDQSLISFLFLVITCEVEVASTVFEAVIPVDVLLSDLANKRIVGSDDGVV